MPRLVRRSLFVLTGLLLAAAATDVMTYDAPAWQADYARLKRDMAQGYANLDWMVERRGLDLVALDRDTTAALQGAHSHVRAFLALRRFTKAFHDPHLRLAYAPHDAAASAPAADTAVAANEVEVDPPAGKDCDAAGYEEGDHAFQFPFASMPGWTPIRQGDFPAGLLGDVGVLRIAQFGEDRYAAACQQVFRAGIGARALQLAVRERLQRGLADAIRDLRQRGARRLLVDVSGNGGGTEWVTDVVALLTDRELVRAQARLVAPGCDRSAMWKGAPATCSALQPATERARLAGTGAWTGPVLVLADRRTGSASEDFIAWLQQNGVATVLGETTNGAGCGYVDGGNRTRLSVAPFEVMMPNCARFLDDGTNEIEGLRPDVALPMSSDDAAQKVRALESALKGPKQA